MKSLLFTCLIAGITLATTAFAEDADKAQAEKDAKAIIGTWAVTELTVNGNELEAKNFEKIRIINEEGNLWSFQVDGKEISRGTNVFDTSQTPHLVDFYVTDGEGRDKHFLGIYELKEDTRRLCFVESGSTRPVDFAAPEGSNQMLMTLERANQEKQE